MTAALTALPPAASRPTITATGSAQGDFAQVLDRVSAFERRDSPADDRPVTPAVRDRAAAPAVRDHADDQPDAPVPGDPATDASRTPGADGTEVDATGDAATAPAAATTVDPAAPSLVVNPLVLAVVPTSVPAAAPTAAVVVGGTAPDAVAPTGAGGVAAAATTTPVTTPAPVLAGAAPVVGPTVPLAAAPVTEQTVTSAGPPADHASAAVPEQRPVASPDLAPSPADRGPVGPSTTAQTSAVVPPAVTAPVAPGAPAPAPAPTAAPTPPPAPPLPLAEQLGARLTTLTGPGGLSHGRHILTVPVDPENLGPVRIVAHIGPESVRVELVGATDASREALRGALADLRRDLAASGLTVDVGPGGDRSEGREQPDRPGRVPWGEARVPVAEPPAPTPVAPDRPPSRGLDLFA